MNPVHKPSRRMQNRRGFLGTAMTASAILSCPIVSQSAVKNLSKKVTFGIIADLHQDVMHDGYDRLNAFVKSMSSVRPDALLQLGDFAYPNEKNKEIIELFNRAHKKTLHVIGNHDTDSGHTIKQCKEIWGMPSRYYVENIEGLNLVVLDGNDKGSPSHKGGYPSFVGEEQVAWLEEQLNKIVGPIIIVSHQPLAGPWAVDNAEEIQKLLSKYSDKILIALNGHSHIDHILKVDGVVYMHVNSASYQWVGGDYVHESYPEHIHKKFPWIAYTCPYKDSLFATLTVDPEKMAIQIHGRKSKWVGKSPADLGKQMHPSLVSGEQVAPRIRNRIIERTNKS